jgi:hypothetical protein
MTRVVNKYKESYDIHIGRGSAWGNPFVIGKDGNREEVISAYRTWILSQIKQGMITQEDLNTLKGKRLGCFCKPQACHGDVLVEILNET